MPSRGLRQGDCLSPYLFLLRADGFSSIINDVARNSMLSGVSICRGSPMVTHLFFADDGLLFCKASTRGCQNLMVTLDPYEAASEQQINANKSSVFFSNNTSPELKAEILEVMGPMQDSKHNKYLGLPSIIRKSKKEVFAEVKEKIEKIYLDGKKKCYLWEEERS